MTNIERALDLWIELTEIDSNSTVIRLSDWDVKQMNSELKE